VANGANSYTWSTSATTNTILVSPTVATVYTVSGISSAGCFGPTSTIAHTLNIAPLPTVSVISSASLLCSGSAATLTAGGAATYSWIGTSGNAQAVISPTTNTTYTVIGTDGNGCSSSATISQSVTICTSVSEMAMSGIEVSVYPNPANQLLHLDVANFNKGTQVIVYSSLGQIVLVAELMSNKSVLDVTKLEAGVYTLTLKNEEKLTYPVKFIKQ
jgi:hypothetical protein